MITANEIMEKIKNMEMQYLINGDESITESIKEKVNAIDWKSKSDINQIYRANIDMPEDDIWCKVFLHNMEENRCVSSKIADNTRYEKIKRIILKIMKVALRWQEEFNTNALRFAQATSDKIGVLTSKNNQLQEQNLVLRQELEKLKLNINAVNDKLKDNSGCLQRISDSVKNNEDWLRGVSDNVKNNEDWLRGVSEIVKNNEDWLRLESSKVDTNEMMYDSLRKELFFELEKNKRDKDYSGSCFEKESGIKKRKTYDKIKINLGCGPSDMEGYINVDMRDLPNVDIVADVLHLPFVAEEVDEIYTSHLVEHFTSMQMLKEILPYWYQLLKKGGVFVAILPNIGYMAQEYVKGNIPFDQLAELISGGQEYEGNYHLSVYDENKIINMLKEVGFSEVNVITTHRKNGLCWEMEIHGVK